MKRAVLALITATLLSGCYVTPMYRIQRNPPPPTYAQPPQYQYAQPYEYRRGY